MNGATKPSFHWQPNGKLVLFVVFFLPLTIALGFWQLSRADQKQALVDEFERRQAAAPVAVDSLNGSVRQYVRIMAQGRFDNERSILLDNRIRQGRAGYEVVTPFEVAPSGRWLLVNRGWIAAGPSREQLPPVPAVTGKVALSGYLYQPGDPFTLGEEQWREHWPQVLQNLDAERLADRLGVALDGYSLRLDDGAPGALRVGWTVINVQPERHIAYAVQWFALAAALVVLALFANSNLGALLRHRR